MRWTLGLLALPVATACEVLAPIGPRPLESGVGGAGSGGRGGGDETPLADAAGAAATGGQDEAGGSANFGGTSGNAMAGGGGLSRPGGSGGTSDRAAGGSRASGGITGQMKSPDPVDAGGGTGGKAAEVGDGGDTGATTGSGEGGTMSAGGQGGTESIAGASALAGGGGGGGVAGTWSTGGVANAGAGPDATTRSSCQNATVTCGTSGEDCCASELVPGGTFSFGIGELAQPSIATLSSFYLDKYEVTAERLATFLAHYDAWREAGNPAVGANTLPSVPGSGWQSDWDAALPRDAATFKANLMNCDGTPTIDLGGAPSLPANCLTWEEAFAFCLWDDARLPTSVEWEYATVGGDQYRPEPWGSAPLAHNRAIYNCLGDGIDGCSLSDVVPVGSVPLGAGRWGQYDLLGSMTEWLLDYFGDYPAMCDDCALIQGDFRTFRGGCWYDTADYLAVARRDYFNPPIRDVSEGVRCARSLE